MMWRGGLLIGLVMAGASMVIAQEPSDKEPSARPERRERPNRPGLQGQNPEMMARGAAMMMKNLPIMKALDVDEDGQLSASEIENASKSLMKLDKNGDGVISAEEMRPEPGQMPMFAGPGGPRGPGGPGGPGAGGAAGMLRMMEMRDKDKDGKLSGDEIPEQMRPRLNMIDENGDGSIDKSEIEKMIARMEGRGGNNRRERQGGGEGVPPRRPPSKDDETDKK